MLTALLSFASTRLGAFALVAFLAFGSGSFLVHRVDAGWYAGQQARAVAAQLAEDNRQIAADHKIALDAAGRAVASDTAAKSLEDKINAYAAQLAARPSGACGLSASDVRRLLSITGGDASAAHPAAGTRHVRPAGKGASAK